VAQENLRRGGPALKLQVLVYPATNLLAEFPSKFENAKGYLLTTDFIDSLGKLVEQGKDLTDPWLSPALSPDLRGLPPALIITAGFDPIRDDGLCYAAQLRAAKIPVELLHYAGQFHGFLNFDSVIGAARDALARMGASLACAFHDGLVPDCSIEISDRALGSGLAPHKLSAELLTAALLISRSTRQFSSAMASRVSPEVTSAAAAVLRPWWVPAALVRRTLTTYLNLPAAQQTYRRSVCTSS